MDNSQGKQSLTVSRYCFGTGPATFSTSKQPMQNGVVSLLTNPKSHRKLKVAGGSAMKGSTKILLLLFICIMLASCEDFYISETEPNDSFETANPMVASTVKGRISVAGDKDYWKLRVNQGEMYYFKLDGLEDDLQLAIYQFSLSNTTWDPSLVYVAYHIDHSGTQVEDKTLIPNEDMWLQFLVEGSGDNDGDEISKYELSYEIMN